MTEAARRLEQLLDREIDLARELAGRLADEQSALTGGSADAVVAAAADKIRLLAHIEELERDRRSMWDPARGDSLVAAVAERWRTLLQLIAGCRGVNEINGHIIHSRQHQIRQLLNIVRGVPTPLTYGPHGKTFATALRALARA